METKTRHAYTIIRLGSMGNPDENPERVVGGKFLYRKSALYGYVPFGGPFEEEDYLKIPADNSREKLTEISQEFLKRVIKRDLNPDSFEIGKYLGYPQSVIMERSDSAAEIADVHLWEARNIKPDKFYELKNRSKYEIVILDRHETQQARMPRELRNVLDSLYYYNDRGEWEMQPDIRSLWDPNAKLRR